MASSSSATMILPVKEGGSDRSSFLLIMCILGMLACAGGSTSVTVRCFESERQALLAFKKNLVDPSNMLASWTTDEEDCCKWSHVGCDSLTGHVVSLNLHRDGGYWRDNNGMRGEIGPSLLQLPYLSHLDLSMNAFTSISEVISSLTTLAYLDVSGNNIGGGFPYHLGNLSMLEHLDLSYNNDMMLNNLEWLARLSSLRVLRLNFLDFAEAENWLQVIKVHPSLSTLDLSFCDFPKINSSSVAFTKPSNSLSFLSFKYNIFDTSTLPWLLNLSTALVYLDLSNTRTSIESIPASFPKICPLKVLYLRYNGLNGPIDDVLQNISCAKKSLEELYLSGNQFTGSIPDISEFESLRMLDVGYNLLNGSFSGRLRNSSKLLTLMAESNQLVGPLDFDKFPALERLYVRNNNLSGCLPRNIAKLSNLTVFDVSHNSLNGVVTETHLSTLSKLQKLILSYNSLNFTISSDFVPSFELEILLLTSCNLGPKFPSWLQHQSNLAYIDISNSGISDTVPNRFWYLPPTLKYLNMSLNQLFGNIPNLLLELNDNPLFDLSSNDFNGPIPQFFSQSSVLILSDNSFSGSLSFLCAPTHVGLRYIDISYNKLSGGLPNCWDKLQNLAILNLGGNSIWGKIPSSMGALTMIETLNLRNNALTGELPVSLMNCSLLKVLDLGENQLIGGLPTWIGESLAHLIVLRLRSNSFHGKINSTICQLGHLQILDLSFNNLSGLIPTCLSNLTMMTLNQSSTKTMENRYIVRNLSYFFPELRYEDSVFVLWKGVEAEYGRTLDLLKLIDLSSNNLIGDTPSEVTDLLGLISLNVSRNNLSGPIPDKIGQLEELEVLDLSHNQISGKIPSNLANIDRLSVLDLSYNKLSGKIPTGTQLQSFNPSAYLGNSGLCGCPLPIKCLGDNDECLNDKGKQEPTTDSSTDNDDTKEDERLFDKSSFYGGMGVGFAAGFSGFSSLLIMNTSWRRSYFQFLNKMWDYLYLIIVLKVARRGFNAPK